MTKNGIIAYYSIGYYQQSRHKEKYSSAHFENRECLSHYSQEQALTEYICRTLLTVVQRLKCGTAKLKEELH